MYNICPWEGGWRERGEDAVSISWRQLQLCLGIALSDVTRLCLSSCLKMSPFGGVSWTVFKHSLPPP